MSSHLLKSARFSHCASICPHNGGTLITYYSGTRECSPDQATRLVYWKRIDGKDVISQTVDMGPGTGNCVIWSANKNHDEAILLYSLFEKYVPERPVVQWMHCSNWLIKVKFIKGEFYFSRPKELGINPRIGCLGRCQPVEMNGEWLLPMYREHNVCGIVMASPDGWNWTERGRIGVTQKKVSNRFGSGILIQPTLWHDGKRLYSLSRDITRSRRAWYSYSDDKGKTWSDPTNAKIANLNNSIVAIQDGTALPMVVWNPGVDRNDARKFIWLGKLVIQHGGLVDGEDVLVADDMSCGLVPSACHLNEVHNDRTNSASYPNYCFDQEENLHIVHSEYPVIRHHIFSKQEVRDIVQAWEEEESSSDD